MATSKARRNARRREAYRWLGAGAVTLGMGVAMTTGQGIAYAAPTDGGSPSATEGENPEPKAPTAPSADPAPETHNPSPIDEAEPGSEPKVDHQSSHNSGANESSAHPKRPESKVGNGRNSAAGSPETAESRDVKRSTSRTSAAAPTPKAAAPATAAAQPVTASTPVADEPTPAPSPRTPWQNFVSAVRHALSSQFNPGAPLKPAPVTPMEALWFLGRRLGLVGTEPKAQAVSTTEIQGDTVEYSAGNQRTLQVTSSSGTANQSVSISVVNTATAAQVGNVSIDGVLVGPVVFNSSKTRAYVTTADERGQVSSFAVINTATGVLVADPVKIRGVVDKPVFEMSSGRVWLVGDENYTTIPQSQQTFITAVNLNTGLVLGATKFNFEAKPVGDPIFVSSSRVLFTMTNTDRITKIPVTYVATIDRKTGALVSTAKVDGTLNGSLAFNSNKSRAYVLTGDTRGQVSYFGVLNTSTGTLVADEVRVRGVVSAPVFEMKDGRVWLVGDENYTTIPQSQQTFITAVNLNTGLVLGATKFNFEAKPVGDPIFVSSSRVLFTMTNTDRITKIPVSYVATIDRKTGALISTAKVDGTLNGSLAFNSNKTRAYVLTGDTRGQASFFGVINTATGALIADPVRVRGIVAQPVFEMKDGRVWLVGDENYTTIPQSQQTFITAVNLNTGLVLGSTKFNFEAKPVGDPVFVSSSRVLFTMTNTDRITKIPVSYVATIDRKTGALVATAKVDGTLNGSLTFNSNKTRAYVLTGDTRGQASFFGIINTATGALIADPVRVRGIVGKPVFEMKDGRVWLVGDENYTTIPQSQQTFITLVNLNTGLVIGATKFNFEAKPVGDPIFVSSSRVLFTMTNTDRITKIPVTYVATIDRKTGALVATAKVDGTLNGSLTFNSNKSRAYVTTGDTRGQASFFGIINTATGALIADPVRVRGIVAQPVFQMKDGRVWLVGDENYTTIPQSQQTFITAVNLNTGLVLGATKFNFEAKPVGDPIFISSSRVLFTMTNTDRITKIPVTYIATIDRKTGALISTAKIDGTLNGSLTFNSNKTRAYVLTSDIRDQASFFGIINTATGALIADRVRVRGIVAKPVFEMNDGRVWLVGDETYTTIPQSQQAFIFAVNLNTGLVIGATRFNFEAKPVGDPIFISSSRVLFTMTNTDRITKIPVTYVATIDRKTGALISTAKIDGTLNGSLTFNSNKSRAYVTTSDDRGQVSYFGIINTATGALIAEPVKIRGVVGKPIFELKDGRVWLVGDENYTTVPRSQQTFITLVNLNTGLVLGATKFNFEAKPVGDPIFVSSTRVLLTMVDNTTSKTHVATLDRRTGQLIAVTG